MDTFVITGPSTVSTSIGLFLGGEGSVAGVAQGDKGTCKSDTFAISGAPHIPTVCGTLTGEHSKFKFYFQIIPQIECSNNYYFYISSVHWCQYWL